VPCLKSFFVMTSVFIFIFIFIFIFSFVFVLVLGVHVLLLFQFSGQTQFIVFFMRNIFELFHFQSSILNEAY